MITTTVIEKEIVEKLGVVLYPVTIGKFFLNKKEILDFLNNKRNNSRYEIDYDYSKCKSCISKKTMLCRKHTSIARVLSGSEKVAFDVDTEVYFLRNEIFKFSGNKLLLVYCPHTKLIQGQFTKNKIKKVTYIYTINNSNVNNDYFLTNTEGKSQLVKFSSNEMFNNKNLKFWANQDFSISMPINDDQVDIYLELNK